MKTRTLIITPEAMMDHRAHTRLHFLSFFLLISALLLSSVSFAEEAQKEKSTQSLDSQIQNLKKEVTRLNRDLFILEEELLFPASTQVIVFLSLNHGNLFTLDAVELKINDDTVATHLYTERELSSLQRGGVQRLFVGNLPTGEHELTALFTGKGPNDVDYRRGATLTFEKALSTKYIELKVVDNPDKQQPDFAVKQW